MKLLNTFFTATVVLVCQLGFSQPLFIDNFLDGVVTKWNGNDHFIITESGNKLNVSIDKNPWESFTLDLVGLNCDNKLVVSFDVRTSKIVTLRLDIHNTTKLNVHDDHYVGKKVPSAVQVIEEDESMVHVVYNFSNKMARLKDKSLSHISFYPDPGSPFEGDLEISNFKISTEISVLRPSKLGR